MTTRPVTLSPKAHMVRSQFQIGSMMFNVEHTTNDFHIWHSEFALHGYGSTLDAASDDLVSKAHSIRAAYEHEPRDPTTYDSALRSLLSFCSTV